MGWNIFRKSRIRRIQGEISRLAFVYQLRRYARKEDVIPPLKRAISVCSTFEKLCNDVGYSFLEVVVRTTRKIFSS